MSEIKRACEMTAQGRVQYRANFVADFDAEVELEEFEVKYVLGNDFSFKALVEIRVSALSREINAFMNYRLELEIDLRDNHSIEIFGRDFSYDTNLEDHNNEILHEAFVAEFRGNIDFEVA